jgi:Na+-driven multidrug efflux pump
MPLCNSFKVVKQGTDVIMHTAAGNLLNAILDAVLIFPLGLGVSGAALATVTSEYVGPIVISFSNKINFQYLCFLILSFILI